MPNSVADLRPQPVALRVLPWWTWGVAFLIFHLGTGLSLKFRIGQGISLWYLPIPLGMILVQWWGPRALLGLYLNAMLCAGYWGLTRWWLWPLYALPETLKVGLSWWFFTRLAKGKCWLPDLRSTWQYLILGIVVPAALASFYAQLQMVALGDLPGGHFWRSVYGEFVLDILSPFAVTIPGLLFLTSLAEKWGLSRTRGAYPRAPLVLSGRFTPAMRYEAVAVFGALFALTFFVPLDRNWFIYGIFLLWAALRFGIGAAALATVWTIALSLWLPAILSNGFGSDWAQDINLQRVNMDLGILCVASLLVGRALSDIYQEIDHRKEVERHLRENEAKYRTLFDSATDAIVLTDAGRIVECNLGSQHMFRGAREDILGRLSTHFFPEFQQDGSRSDQKILQLRAAALSGNPQGFEWTLKRLDGTLFECQAHMNVVVLDGKPLAQTLIRDISDVKRSQEMARTQQQQLIQADKMNSLGRMVSGVAHEINNPNNLIMLNTDVLETFWRHIRPVLRERWNGNPEWKLAGIPYGSAEGKLDGLFSGLAGGANRIKRIVDNLKDFARVDPGDVTETVAVGKVIDASVGIVEHLIRKATDHFRVDTAENLPPIRGNFQKLEQVIINLITNACQALENRSKAIRIATHYEPASHEVVIRVEDEGRGIPREHLHKVADPFFTTKRDSGGTGLGLSVSYGIIQEHGGRMEFHSEADQGTAVTLRIPAMAEKPGRREAA